MSLNACVWHWGLLIESSPHTIRVNTERFVPKPPRGLPRQPERCYMEEPHTSTKQQHFLSVFSICACSNSHCTWESLQGQEWFLWNSWYVFDKCVCVSFFFSVILQCFFFQWYWYEQFQWSWLFLAKSTNMPCIPQEIFLTSINSHVFIFLLSFSIIALYGNKTAAGWSLVGFLSTVQAFNSSCRRV